MSDGHGLKPLFNALFVHFSFDTDALPCEYDYNKMKCYEIVVREYYEIDVILFCK